MTAIVSETATPASRREFARYFVCSALALAADASMYRVALHLGAAYQFAAVIGFVAGVSIAYLLSVRWAFKQRSVTNPQIEFLIFLGIGIAGLALTEALLWFQISVCGSSPMIAKLLAAVGVFMFNFGARKLVPSRRQREGVHSGRATRTLHSFRGCRPVDRGAVADRSPVPWRAS
jgi:putative flippase GtrA